MNSKTICIFSTHYYPNIGGIAVFTHNLARALSERGERVLIITYNLQGLPPREVTQEGFEIYRLPCYSLIDGRFPFPRRNKEYRNLLSEITATRIDGILINTRFYAHTIEALKLSRKKNCKAIIIDHGADYLTFGNAVLDLFVKAYEHWITAKTKRYQPDYYGISQASVDWIKTFGIEAKGVISNAIDAEQFIDSRSKRNYRAENNIDDDDVVIVFTGRLIPEKGIDLIISVAKKLEQESSCKFLIAGDGPLRSKLEKSKLSNLHYVGRLNGSDISALLHASDIFCFPSRSEGFGGSLLEAAVCENVLISTDVGIASELIPSENYGIRFENMPTAEELKTAIDFLCANPELMKRMSRLCAGRARDIFSWDNTVGQVRNAFAESDDDV